jgi:hypothetical protein
MLASFGYQVMSGIIVGNYTPELMATQYMAAFGISIII